MFLFTEAVSESKYFHVPNSTEFRQDMIEAIRNAKQRIRNSINNKKEDNKSNKRLQEEMQHIFAQRQKKYLRKE